MEKSEVHFQPQPVPEKAVSQPVTGVRKGQKRKRRRSNEANASAGTEEGAVGDSEKRQRIRQMSVSSKTVANHVMKTRVLGSESDPLNLEGVSGGKEVEECSTCAPSPVFGDGGQPSPLPPHLRHDPLNLEGRVWEHPGPNKRGGNRKRHGGKRRAASCTEEGREEGRGGGEFRGGRGGRGRGGRGGIRRRSQSKKMETDTSTAPGPAFHPPVFKPQDQRYCYGNYDMYYGYRCGSSGAVEVADPRVALMKREWFEGKECLDIGSNTGQITLAIAQQFGPQRIVGVDIDQRLVRIANKNLFRHHVPLIAPDGRAFPSSFTSKASFSLLSKSDCSSRLSTSQSFPNNVEFKKENYVPDSEEEVTSTCAQFDVILALSITKWVHLNWGDAGLRRMFRKMFHHLRPGGKLILEPQPFSSYARKKKLTPAIYKNYYAIKFRPEQFHSYLMSQEVGFSEHKFLGIPHHKSEGFRRPLHAYIKSNDGSGSGCGGGGGNEQLEEGGGEEGCVEGVGGSRGRGGMETEAAVVTEDERRMEGEETHLVKEDSSSQCDSVEQESRLDRTSGE